MRPLVIAITCLAACGGATPVVTPAHVPVGVDLARGTYVFDVQWVASAEAANVLEPDQPLAGAVELDGELRLAFVDEALARIDLLAVTRFELDLGRGEDDEDRRVSDTAVAELAGCGAWIELQDGPADALLLEGSPSPLCRHVLRHLAVQIDPHTVASDSPRLVTTSYGAMQATYATADRTVSRIAEGRTANGAPSRAHTVLQADAQGRLETLSSAQWLVEDGPEGAPIAQSRVTLTRTSFEPTRWAAPGEEPTRDQILPEVDGTRQQLALARGYADGLDRLGLGLSIAHVDNEGKLREGFAIRARGLMLAEPELARDVASMFARARRPVTRQLVVDLLSQAGTEVARSELRGLLQGVVDRGEDDRGLLLQRLGLLDEPEPADLEFALDLHRRAVAGGDALTRRAVLHVLGMLGRKLETDAAGAHQRLRAELDPALPVDIRRAAIAGLGNARRPEDLVLVMAHVLDPDDEIRSTAALALRWMPASLVRPWLRVLVADESPTVAEAARIALEVATLEDVARG